MVRIQHQLNRLAIGERTVSGRQEVSEVFTKEFCKFFTKIGIANKPRGKRSKWTARY